MKTPIMLTPTLQEVERAADKIGLPQREAEKFFHYYESNGWRVGKTKMVSFTNALAGWKLRYEDRERDNKQRANIVGLQKEYDRILERMKAIRNSYGEIQSWSERDKVEFKKLKDRRDQLRNVLGIMI